MNSLNNISNKVIVSSFCFGGGYILNSVSIAVNQYAVKYLGLPIDLLNHEKYSDFSNNSVDTIKQFCHSHGIKLYRQLGSFLSDFTIFAITEEISYRFLLERMALPFLSSQFANFSIARTSICSLIFASSHLLNRFPSEALIGQFFNTAFLSMICSLAQQRIGLIGSILIHVGYNIHAWQYTYNQNWASMIKAIKAIRLIDVMSRRKILIYSVKCIEDVFSLPILAYRGVKEIKNFLLTF